MVNRNEMKLSLLICVPTDLLRSVFLLKSLLYLLFVVLVIV